MYQRGQEMARSFEEGMALYRETMRQATREVEAAVREMQRWSAELAAVRADIFCNASWLGKQIILMQYGWDQIRGR